MKGMKNLSFPTVKRPKGANRCILCVAVKKSTTRFGSRLIHIIFRTVHFQQLKEMQNSKLGILKWYLFSIEVIGKGCPFCRIWYIKG